MATIDSTGVTLEAFVAGDHTVEATHANRLKVAWMYAYPDVALPDLAGHIEGYLWKCLQNEVLTIEKRMANAGVTKIDVETPA